MPGQRLPSSGGGEDGCVVVGHNYKLSSSPGRRSFEDTQRFNRSSNYSSVFFVSSFSFLSGSACFDYSCHLCLILEASVQSVQSERRFPVRHPDECDRGVEPVLFMSRQ